VQLAVFTLRTLPLPLPQIATLALRAQVYEITGLQYGKDKNQRLVTKAKNYLIQGRSRIIKVEEPKRRFSSGPKYI
jgi:hypothetical protein